jgi:hypothetical protein
MNHAEFLGHVLAFGVGGAVGFIVSINTIIINGVVKALKS